jgi:hypothetical protein
MKLVENGGELKELKVNLQDGTIVGKEIGKDDKE